MKNDIEHVEKSNSKLSKVIYNQSQTQFFPKSKIHKMEKSLSYMCYKS